MPNQLASDLNTSGFSRRHYHSIREHLVELSYLLRRLPKVISYYSRLPADLRERLMLTITAVNQCYYCQAFHTQLAKAAGISHEECELINSGQIDPNTPDTQRPALAYAHSWASHGGDFNANARPALQANYPEEMIDAIELAIRGIWVGNLSGNTWDYWLYRLTFGRFGQ